MRVVDPPVDPRFEREKARFLRMTDRARGRWMAAYWRKALRFDKAWQRYRIKVLVPLSLTSADIRVKMQDFKLRFSSPAQDHLLRLQYEACRLADKRHARREDARRRRERILNSPVSVIDRRDIYRRDSGQCSICGRHVPLKRMTLDHVVSLAKRGEHTQENLRVAHRICNMLKGTRRRVNFWCMKCLQRWPRRDRVYSSSCACGARWHVNANNRRGRFRVPEMLDTVVRRR